MPRKRGRPPQTPVRTPAAWALLAAALRLGMGR